jgi:hypothetical protein
MREATMGSPLSFFTAARRYFNRLKNSADTASDPVSRIKPLVQP